MYPSTYKPLVRAFRSDHIWLHILGIFLLTQAFSLSVHAAEALDDSHIAGYALAVLEQQFHVGSGSVSVRDGVVTVTVDDIRGSDRTRLVEALGRIRGVRDVEVRSEREVPPAPALAIVNSGSQWFPQGHLFEPLHADPRWPHFAATARTYVGPGEGNVDTAFAGDFGETLSIYRNDAPLGEWEVGIQAGVFSLFDIGSASKHLINADYLIGALAGYRSRDWSVLLRYVHQSSHLGDEFLLNSNVARNNISYELIDAKLSYTFFDVLRLYGGLGALVRQDASVPSGLRYQAGVEVESPKAIMTGIKPVAYADFQMHQHDTVENGNGSVINVSIRTGFQFENLRILDRTIQLLFEYYNGRSPNGQFFVQRIETMGLGLHVYF